jgi:hypothetical protein
VLSSDGEDDFAGFVVPLAHWPRDYAGGMGKMAVTLIGCEGVFRILLVTGGFSRRPDISPRAEKAPVQTLATRYALNQAIAN